MRVALLLVLGPLVQAADIVEVARAAAPELFADTILRLVEAGKIPDRTRQTELLEDSFAAAAGAQEPLPVTAIFGTPPQTRAMYRSKASELGLDALSLQARVLKAMLMIDRAKAREMFGRVLRPAIDPRPCEDPLVPNASAYYQIAGALAQSGFTVEERDRGAHVQFLQTALAGARSPIELAEFTQAIRSVDLKPPEWELLLSSLASKLETIADDYRSFALSIGGLRAEVEHLAGRARAMGLRTDLLALAFRTYLVVEMRAPRCGEDFGEGPQAVEWFNSSFRGELPAIGEAQIKPSEVKGTIQPSAYFVSEDSKGLGAALTRLQFAPEGKPTSVADRSTGEWHKLLTDFLHDLEAWQPVGSAVDVLHQKAYVLRAVLELAPPGEDRDRLIGLCVTFLQSSAAERQNPAEWLWQVQAMVRAAAGDASKMLRGFRDSGGVGLALYAEQ